MPLFTVAEARAFDREQLADPTRYPDALLEEAESRIRQDLQQICSVAFVQATDAVFILDGTGTDTLALPPGCRNPLREKPPRPVSVAALEIDGVPIDPAVILAYPTAVSLSSGVFPRGRRNIEITYTYGWAAVPGEIKRAALLLALTQLIGTDVPMGADSYSVGGSSWSFVAGSGPERWTGLPEVNARLSRYTEHLGVA